MPVAKSSTAISVTGDMEIRTFQKEFNKKFPYLNIFMLPHDSESINLLRTFASFSCVDSGGDISISGHKKVKSLKSEFYKVFGLYVFIDFWNIEGSLTLAKDYFDEMTLSALNKYSKENGRTLEDLVR